MDINYCTLNVSQLSTKLHTIDIYTNFISLEHNAVGGRGRGIRQDGRQIGGLLIITLWESRARVHEDKGR